MDSWSVLVSPSGRGDRDVSAEALPVCMSGEGRVGEHRPAGLADRELDARTAALTRDVLVHTPSVGPVSGAWHRLSGRTALVLMARAVRRCTRSELIRPTDRKVAASRVTGSAPHRSTTMTWRTARPTHGSRSSTASQ